MQKNLALINQRLMKRKTQKEIAQFVGISTNAYRAYESGEPISFPSAEKALKIANCLETTVEDIFSPQNVLKTHKKDS